MGYAGVTIFLVFFGISLLDALVGGHWLRAWFWVAIGLAFWAFDRVKRERGGKQDSASGSAQ